MHFTHYLLQFMWCLAHYTCSSDATWTATLAGSESAQSKAQSLACNHVKIATIVLIAVYDGKQQSGGRVEGSVRVCEEVRRKTATYIKANNAAKLQSG